MCPLEVPQDKEAAAKGINNRTCEHKVLASLRNLYLPAKHRRNQNPSNQEVCKERNLSYKIEKNSLEVSTEDILKKYKRGEHIILPVGGDGTINRVLNGIVGTKNVLGYIPMGMIKGINTIDLGKVNEKYFINVVCFGIDADIGNHSDIIHSTWIPQKSRYKLGLMVHFVKYKPKNFIVQMDHHRYEDDYTTIAVCNARYYGGGFKIAPNSSLDDGLFDVYLIKKMNKFKMLRLLTGLKNALHEKSKKTIKKQVNHLKITSLKEVGVNIDGEEYKNTVFDFQLIRDGIRVYYDQELIDEILKKK